ncbi:MAG: hypothetical protein HQM08_27560 [Candidatus Riflebacteria bacterium]|nr:hypothetical protein [Candidatus Riflebacteria bacterium]
MRKFLNKNKCWKFFLNNSGMAVPIALLFTLIIFTFFFSLSQFRSSVKKQNLASHTQKKAYYMAMGGVQHALLKLRLLPTEAYKASCLAKGICPFFNPRGNTLISTTIPPTNIYSQSLDQFRCDLNSASMPFSFTDPEIVGGAHPWKYEVCSFSISVFYTSTDTASLGLVREDATIRVMGYAFDARDDSLKERIEFVEKQVEMKRKIQ